MGFALPPGIYEALLNDELSSVLKSHPELRSVFGKVDPEEETRSAESLRIARTTSLLCLHHQEK